MTNFTNASGDYPDQTDCFYFARYTEGSKNIVETTHSICFDVVDEFYHFMLGSGYAFESVVSAMEQVVTMYGQEIKPTLKGDDA